MTEEKPIEEPIIEEEKEPIKTKKELEQYFNVPEDEKELKIKRSEQIKKRRLNRKKKEEQKIEIINELNDYKSIREELRQAKKELEQEKQRLLAEKVELKEPPKVEVVEPEVVEPEPVKIFENKSAPVIQVKAPEPEPEPEPVIDPMIAIRNKKKLNFLNKFNKNYI